MNFWIKHLLNWFLFSGTMFLAAGAVADVAGGADGGAADAGNTDAGGDGSAADDHAADGAADVADDAAGDAAANQDDAAATQADQDAAQKLDGRSLPPKVKELMDGLQKADPKAHVWLKDRLYAERQFRQEFPGGLQEAKSLKTVATSLRELVPPTLQAAAPEQILGAVRDELSEGRALDDLFEKGDPKLFERMIEFSPEGFKKLLPVAVNKFSQIDPEGYQRTMAGILHNTLQSSNVLNTLGFVSRLLAKGDTAGAIEELKSITEWATSIGELAKSKPAETRTDPAIDQRAQQLEQREMQLWINETATPINNAKTQAIKAELKQYVKDQQIDDETYDALEGQCLRFLNQLLNADPNFATTFDAYVKNRDREGVTKFMQSKLKELLPSKPGKMGPVERAYKLFFRGAPAKPKPGQQQRPNQQQQKPAPKGWERIASDKAPQPHEIDKAQTSFEMSFAKAAILKNGKRVFWGEQPPAA